MGCRHSIPCHSTTHTVNLNYRDETRRKQQRTAAAAGGAAADADEKTVLPPSCEYILKRYFTDTTIHTSSNRKLLSQLRSGVYSDDMRKKYWIDERNRNCFILFARDLSICWGENPSYWRWSSEEQVDVADLVEVCWLDVTGKFDISHLSPHVTYSILFNVKINDTANGFQSNPVNLRLTVPGKTPQEHAKNLMQYPKGQWIEIPVGQLKTSNQESGEMTFSLHEHSGTWKRGLVIKGVVIRPADIME